MSGLSTSLSCWLFRENEATTNLLEIVLVQEIPAMRICESLSHKHAFQFPGFQSLVRHNSSIRFSPTSFFFSSSHHTPNSTSLRISLLLTHPSVLQVSILQETKPPRVSVKRLSGAIYKQEKRKGNVSQVRESSESGSAL